MSIILTKLTKGESSAACQPQEIFIKQIEMLNNQLKYQQEQLKHQQEIFKKQIEMPNNQVHH